MQEKIVSDRHRIEAEFSRNAEELERARREKEDALAQQRAVEAQIKTLAAEKARVPKQKNWQAISRR